MNNNQRQTCTFHSIVVLLAMYLSGAAIAQEDPYAEPAEPGLPPSTMELDLSRTALVITDPQIDFLSPDGVTWGIVGNSVTANKTVEHIEQLLIAAKENDIAVFISPHYYYPTDHGWKFEGALEKVMHSSGMFDRVSPYSMDGFEESGADFMPQYKKYLFDGKTIFASPHKVYGPEQNDLVLQLRKLHIDQLLLAVKQVFFVLGIVGNSVTANKTVEHIEQLLIAAKENDIAVFISPHYYYPTDHGWKFEGALEKVMHSSGMFDRVSPYSMDGFEESGADFMPQYKKYLFDGVLDRDSDVRDFN